MPLELYLGNILPKPIEVDQESHVDNDEPVKNFVAKTEDVTVIQIQTPHGLQEEVVRTIEYIPQPKKKSERLLHKHDKYAVLIRRILERHGNQDILIRTELCVQSDRLCKELRDIVGDTYDSFNINGTPIVMHAPFFELFFKRDTIINFPQTVQDVSLRAEAALLSTFVQEDNLTIRNKHEYSILLNQGKISFATLWTLFPPNTRMYRVDDEALECWLCRDVSVQYNTLQWVITGARIGCNGSNIGLEKVQYPISFMAHVGGVMDIADLPLLPEKYVPLEKLVMMKSHLVKRGKALIDIMHADLDGHAYRSYRGPVWKSHHIMEPPKKKSNEYVVVDCKEYLNRHPDHSPRLITQKNANGYGSDSDSVLDSERVLQAHGNNCFSLSDEDFTSDKKSAIETLFEAIQSKYEMESLDDLLLLCPARIPAYGLKSKDWGWILLDNLHTVQPSSAAFNSLQYDKDIKTLIRTLVKGHHSDTEDKFDDFTTNKGKGLIILLHGDPGSGKTLTAESIASLHGSPLYSVSGGELGVNVSFAEKKLEDIFELGNRWKAVVLLDEADVIMSKRSSQELERNAIVAVWLRMIEYFQGVLFLTSNRVDDLDEAFRSRIHLSIKMKGLDQPTRQEIWKSLIRYNNSVVDESSWTEEAFSALSRLEVNGRVIKNLIRTAICFAKASGPDTLLSVYHLAIVIKAEFIDREGTESVVEDLQRNASINGKMSLMGGETMFP